MKALILVWAVVVAAFSWFAYTVSGWIARRFIEMKNKNKIPISIIFAAVAFFAVSAFSKYIHLPCEQRSPIWLCQFLLYFDFNWFNTYQTFVSAIIALLGAGLGVSAINRQIQQAEQFEHQRTQSKHAAARAYLPLALSAIGDYAEQCGKALSSLLDECTDGVLPAGTPLPAFPPLPTEALSALKEMIEFAPSEERDTIAKIIEKIQIQRSRISAIGTDIKPVGHIVSEENLEQFIIDSAELSARAAAVFEFARRVTTKIPSQELSAEGWKSALHHLGIFDDLYDKLSKKIEMRSGK